MELRPLEGKQLDAFHLSTRRFNILEGAVSSSKTIVSLLAWFDYVRNGPAGNLAMVGKTERTLERNIIAPIHDLVGPRRARYVRGIGELHLFGRTIWIYGANDERAQDKIRGVTFAGAYGDEVTLWPESFFKMLASRLRVPGARFFGTTNPDHPAHWLLVDWLDKWALWVDHDGRLHDRTHLTEAQADEQPSDDPEQVSAGDVLDLARFSFRLADNPALDDAYVRNLAKEYVGLWRLRFIVGKWVAAEGTIYDWDPTVDDGGIVFTDREGPTVDDIAGGKHDVWLSVDYGTATVFHALLWTIAPHPDDGRDCLWVLDEWRWDARERRKQLTDQQYVTKLDGWLARWGIEEPGQQVVRIWVDPSASSFITALHEKGWPVSLANNSVDDGLRFVASVMAAGRLAIAERCRMLVKEKTGYIWDPDAKERGEEEPLKRDDHGPDAERYGLMGLRRHWRHWLLDDETVTSVG